MDTDDNTKGSESGRVDRNSVLQDQSTGQGSRESRVRQGVSQQDSHMAVGCAPLFEAGGPLKMDPDDNTEGSESRRVVCDSVH
jgi:hypothetical protein